MLRLVEFAGFDRRVRLAETVESGADGLQPIPVVPVDEFRADETGVGAVELGDEHRHRPGVGGDVVVTQEEEPVVASDEVEYPVGGTGETRRRVDLADERAGEDLVDQGPGSAVGVGGEEDEPAQVGIVLGREGLQGLSEPGSGFVDHDDTDHGDRFCCLHLPRG